MQRIKRVSSLQPGVEGFAGDAELAGGAGLVSVVSREDLSEALAAGGARLRGGGRRRFEGPVQGEHLLEPGSGSGLAFAQEEEPLDDVPQLADVAGPA